MTAPSSRRVLVGVSGAVALLGTLGVLLLPGTGKREVWTFDTAGRPMLGQGGVEVVVFSDYQCLNCKTFEQTHLPLVEDRLVRTGRAHVVFLHSPFLGADSTKAAIAAECAFRQGKYRAYSAGLFARQGAENSGWVTNALLRQLAREAGLSEADFERCTSSAEARAQVRQDLAQHERVGLRGTPEVFVEGRRTPAGVGEISAAVSSATLAQGR